MIDNWPVEGSQYEGGPRVQLMLDNSNGDVLTRPKCFRQATMNDIETWLPAVPDSAWREDEVCTPHTQAYTKARHTLFSVLTYVAVLLSCLFGFCVCVCVCV